MAINSFPPPADFTLKKSWDLRWSKFTFKTSLLRSDLRLKIFTRFDASNIHPSLLDIRAVKFEEAAR